MADLRKVINLANALADDNISDSYVIDWYNAFLSDIESVMPITSTDYVVQVQEGDEIINLPEKVLRILEVYWQPQNDSNWYPVNSYFARPELNQIILNFKVNTSGSFKIIYKKFFNRVTEVTSTIDIPAQYEHLAALFIAAMYKEQQTDYDEADRLWNLFEVRKDRLFKALEKRQDVYYINWEGVYNG